MISVSIAALKKLHLEAIPDNEDVTGTYFSFMRNQQKIAGRWWTDVMFLELISGVEFDEDVWFDIATCNKSARGGGLLLAYTTGSTQTLLCEAFDKIFPSQKPKVVHGSLFRKTTSSNLSERQVCCIVDDIIREFFEKYWCDFEMHLYNTLAGEYDDFLDLKLELNVKSFGKESFRVSSLIPDF